jgi:exodeoxyribonuclease V alpha subunit
MVVDEMSMVDSLLFESLLKALPVECKLILVGDYNQLPSVGAGNVLRDIIASRKLPVIRLNKIFRQAEESYIVLNAHKIIKGEYPELTRMDSDFFFLEHLDNSEAVKVIAGLVKTRLPKAYGYSPMDDIQILSPTRKGILGTVELNKVIQHLLNPPHPKKSEVKSFLYTLREGDKVMQTKNNYSITWKKEGAKVSDDEEGTGIFNGDIGRIKSISKATNEMIIDFDSRIVRLTGASFNELELAYAITVHKSQGSEFEAVIIPVADCYEKLSHRSLLYTAVTRAKRLLILVGRREKIYEMVDNNMRQARCSCLRYMLANET